MTSTALWQASPDVVEVRINKAVEVDTALEEAVAAVKDRAIRHRTGILVARVSPGRYTVRAHPGVPYGLIQQQYG